VARPYKPIVCYVTDRKALARPASANTSTTLLDNIRLAAQAGADWVQIREKDLTGKSLLVLTRQAVEIANKAVARENGGALRIYVNDRLDAALAGGAAGVHLGGESPEIADVARWVRVRKGHVNFQVGVSCHSVESAVEAEKSGADYIFFGPVFDTPSKRSFGAPQGLGRLHEVCAAVRIPVIAIGGVNGANAGECILSGAAGIAAIRLFQDAGDVEMLAHFISQLHDVGSHDGPQNVTGIPRE
jgi:thiamine-phosphate pyrophosphorylase